MNNLVMPFGAEGRQLIIVMDRWNGHMADSLQLDILLLSQDEPTYTIESVQGYKADDYEQITEFPEHLRDELEEIIEEGWAYVTGKEGE